MYIIISTTLVMVILIFVIKKLRFRPASPLDKNSVQSLDAYISRMRALGRSDDEIKESLVKVGWNEKEIKGIFKK